MVNYIHESGASGTAAAVHVIRLKELLELTKLSRSTVYALMRESDASKGPRFPPGFLITQRTRGWFLSDVVAYLDARRNLTAK